MTQNTNNTNKQDKQKGKKGFNVFLFLLSSFLLGVAIAHFSDDSKSRDYDEHDWNQDGKEDWDDVEQRLEYIFEEEANK